MHTDDQAEPRGNLPSTAQSAYLQALAPKGPVLLQYHITWGINEDREAHADHLIEAIHELSGRLLSIASVDLLAIGESKESSDEIWLLEFPNIALVRAHIDSPEVQAVFAELDSLTVYLASTPPPRMLRVLKWMNRLLPLLPAYRSADKMPEEELQGGINPTKQQFATFEQADQRCTVHMFNLLKFHDRARYPDGDRGRSGRRAYEDGYGRVAMACFLRLNGRIIMLGRYRMTLIGAGGEVAADAWDEIAVIQYPNRPAFVRMVSTPRYIRALQHRHAGLVRTQVWSTSPGVEYCQ